jgi:hypothetical protein
VFVRVPISVQNTGVDANYGFIMKFEAWSETEPLIVLLGLPLTDDPDKPFFGRAFWPLESGARKTFYVEFAPGATLLTGWKVTVEGVLDQSAMVGVAQGTFLGV